VSVDAPLRSARVCAPQAAVNETRTETKTTRNRWSLEVPTQCNAYKILSFIYDNSTPKLRQPARICLFRASARQRNSYLDRY